MERKNNNWEQQFRKKLIERARLMALVEEAGEQLQAIADIATGYLENRSYTFQEVVAMKQSGVDRKIEAIINSLSEKHPELGNYLEHWGIPYDDLVHIDDLEEILEERAHSHGEPSFDPRSEMD